MESAETKSELESLVNNSLNNLLKIEPQPIAIIQTGSSITEDYVEGLSDIDFMVISRNPEALEGDAELSNFLCARYPKKFLRRLKRGHSFELASLKFGRVLHDRGFVDRIDNKSQYKPTEITIKDYMMSAINQYSHALENYFTGSVERVINCSYKSVKSCCKILATRKTNEIYETFNDVVNVISEIDETMAEKLSFLYFIRKNWKKNLEKLPAKDKIYENDAGRFILAAEGVLRYFFRKEGYSLPRFNDLIPENAKEIETDVDNDFLFHFVRHNFNENKISYCFGYVDENGNSDNVFKDFCKTA